MNVDRLGSVVSLSNAAGNRQNPVAYLAFGTSSTGAPPAGAGFGYAGYRYDAETGLYYVRQRLYDPRLGRFLQPDPIRQNGGMNIYAYVNNDPLNLTDPSGLCAGNGCGNSNPSNQLLRPSDAITPIYPLEYAIGAVTGGSALRTLGGAIVRQFLPDPAPVSPPPPATQGNPFGIPTISPLSRPKEEVALSMSIPRTLLIIECG